MSDRVYTEEEVAALIRRAVQMEAERDIKGNKEDQHGLSIHDLEKIAADAGIDPELMREAAVELEKDTIPGDIDEARIINNREIVAEHWIKGKANSHILNNLIIELNQHFGTSQDEISWWNNLFNDYSGKAIVNKTATSADWKYKTEAELYTTRALIQQRGNKLRIRVSKRQFWNLPWYSKGLNIFAGSVTAILLIIFGAVLGFSLLESPLIGIIGGIALTAILIPLTSKFINSWLKKHVNEVTQVAENLVIQAKQMLNEAASQNESQTQTDTKVIEIDSQNSDAESAKSTGRLKNHLRHS